VVGTGKLVVVCVGVLALALLGTAGVQAMHCHGQHSGHAAGDQAATGQRDHGSHSPATSSQCVTCGKAVGDMPVTIQADKSYPYRCINCALIDSDRRGDCVITAHSALSHTPIKLERKGGKWSATPDTAVALSLPEHQGECQDRHLVFANEAEFRSYLSQHGEIARLAPKPLPLTGVDQILKAGHPPLPAEATCPVSGRTFKPTLDSAWTVRDGKVYYFCCPECKSEFNKP